MQRGTADLINFIQKEDRVGDATLGHTLNDTTRHRADIGTSMASNFGFIGDAAQRRFEEFAVQSAGDGLS